MRANFEENTLKNSLVNTWRLRVNSKTNKIGKH